MADKSIEFSSAAQTDNGFRFVLDSAENSDRTIFYPGFTARLKLYPGGRNPEITASLGTASFYARNLKQTVTEFLVFKNSRKITAGYPVNSIISAVWLGMGAGKPSFQGRAVTLPSEQTGVLRLTYQTSYDLLDITCRETAYILVTAEDSGLTGSHVLDYTDGYDTGLFNRVVVLTVRDACSKEVLSGAYVYINGRYAGKSDSEGRVRLGSMKTGTYSLLVKKDGYKSTDEDNVCNDFFTVE